jgi:hypothetical protein
MGREGAESGQSSTRRRSRTVTTEPNGSSSGSRRKETVKDSPVATARRETKPKPRQPEEPPLELEVFELGEAEEPAQREKPALQEDESPPGLITFTGKLSEPVHPTAARYRIARAAMIILGLVVIASFVILWRANAKTDDLTRVLEIIFAPIVALVGVTLAFYYYRPGSGSS